MNLIENERLAVLAKMGNDHAKEDLANNFKPFILNLCKKTFLNGYEFEDVQNECYKSLFKALNKYNPENKRFVAYATRSIKNALSNLIRSSTRHEKTDSRSILTLTDCLEHTLAYDIDFVEDELFPKIEILNLKAAIRKLSKEEKELIEFVYIKNQPLKAFAKQAGIPYSTSMRMRNRSLERLKEIIGG
ncbi:sigma-70 family RNA polymerase sigma factor [Clostridium intestinale]|uniref:sigma-70 family RNA polymerase sigma factor n=1 Tax=Clostridium intestinale TaxID=36845 RepID=UPI002DD6B28B|nr:sigma-70 family RNA polymerase sigma factor [Clostridium intestinale]WRY52654.1 sigma-70 family RNA polymerase sigma factor [Clostridium intestinale]